MAAIQASATETALENQRIGPLQLRVAAICLLAQTFDGFDLASIGMAAPALSQVMASARPSLRHHLRHVQRRHHGWSVDLRPSR